MRSLHFFILRAVYFEYHVLRTNRHESIPNINKAYMITYEKLEVLTTSSTFTTPISVFKKFTFTQVQHRKHPQQPIPFWELIFGIMTIVSLWLI